MGRQPSPKTSQQRAAENARYQKRIATFGIVKVAVHVPAERVTELRTVALTWRAEAKMLMDVDYPTAEQILQIFAICRTLRLDLGRRLRDLFVGRTLASRPRKSHRTAAASEAKGPADAALLVPRGPIKEQAMHRRSTQPLARAVLGAFLAAWLTGSALAQPINRPASNIAPSDARSVVAALQRPGAVPSQNRQ